MTISIIIDGYSSAVITAKYPVNGKNKLFTTTISNKYGNTVHFHNTIITHLKERTEDILLKYLHHRTSVYYNVGLPHKTNICKQMSESIAALRYSRYESLKSYLRANRYAFDEIAPKSKNCWREIIEQLFVFTEQMTEEYLINMYKSNKINQ